MNQLETLIQLLSRMPGVGRKSAARISYWFLQTESDYNQALSDAIRTLQDQIHPCPQCGNYTDQEICHICEDPRRERRLLCVVEQPQDVLNVESTGEFQGLYHVLHGVLAPLDGVGPEELGLTNLLNRTKNLGVEEIIIATNPTLDGDSTALYIQQLYKEQNVRISRIATGLPVGGDLEYVDKLSLARSFRARLDLGIS